MKVRPTSKLLTDADGKVRELTATDLHRALPASDVLSDVFSPDLAAQLLKPRRRGPGKKQPKVTTTIRLPPETLAAWKASGPGWQTRMAELLSQRAPRSR
jgi:uncharacterized protein (DUF4415 family)